MTRAARLALFFFLASPLFAVERFPPPDFESGHELPSPSTPNPYPGVYDIVDVAALAVALGLASYFALVRRRRRYLLVLSLASIAYFGFWKRGCVCPIGAIQNVALSLFDSTYAAPAGVALFFLLPLAGTLLFGRTYCSSVCPHGALQDAVLLRPVKVPRWLEHALGLLAYVYLGLAVAVAATGSQFLICRYDPFIALFRLSGDADMMLLGIGFLVLGLFVGRPYCRYLCPYGALLRLFSLVSWKHVTITPDDCIRCHLCNDACPYDAIREPTAEPEVSPRAFGLRRLAFLLLAATVFVAAGAWLGPHLGPPLSRLHPTVNLAELVVKEEKGLLPEPREEVTFFRRTGRSTEELQAEAALVRARFVPAGRLLGSWIGLVLGGKLVSLGVRRRRENYEPDRGKCVSCGRCFASCPKERERRKKVGTAA